MPKRSRFEPVPSQFFDAHSQRLNRHIILIVASRFTNHALGRLDRRGVRLDFLRTFGLHTFDDSALFATVTGRLQFLQRAFRAFVDRRRRQAYLILRRVLPRELAGPISMQNVQSY